MIVAFDYLPYFLHIGRQAIRNAHGRVLEANSDSKGMHLNLNTESGAFLNKKYYVTS